MKRTIIAGLILLVALTGFPQESFRLLVEPGKPQLAGDGEDFTTLVISARNGEGEVITGMSGKVKIGVSSGFPDETEVNMQSGVALVKFTSPMFGTPVKSSQRMVYFMFRFMQKFMARATGSTDYAANQRLATGVALETFREGLNPITLIPKKEGDNFVYVVCELNGVKGKAKIEITKATDGRNGNIVPGVYYGKDITGQSSWFLDITRGGEGTFGEASPEADANGILFSNEDFTEFNDAMGKMAGMTGFKKAFIGLPASEQKYVENYSIRDMGMPSAYMPMPNHGVFVYIPPILFEYAGQKKTNEVAGTDEKEVRTEKTGIVFSQNKIVGDGRSRTKAVFHFEDENGRPVEGKAVTWSIPGGLKVISKETVTDANGNAVVELEAPVIKATEEKRGENTGGLIDNYDLFLLKAAYASLSEKTETTQANLSVYKTMEQDIYILKPGMEATPYKVLLPQLEYYNLESSIYALLPESYMTVPNVKTPVNDAVVFLASRNFDKAQFQTVYDMYFRKDRALFMQLLDNEKGGFAAVTDAAGKYKLIVRDFEGKRRLYTGDYERKLNIEPLESKIADLTGRHKGALTEALSLLADGDTDVAASAAAGDPSINQSMHALDFKAEVLGKLLEMERALCSGAHQDALFLEEKLHITGMLMTNIKGSARYVRDCAKVFGEQSYEALKFLMFYAAEKFKFNEKMGAWLKDTRAGDKLTETGVQVSGYLDNYLSGIPEDAAKRSIAQNFLMNVVSQFNNLPKEEYYRLMGHAANYVLTEKQKDMLDAVVNAVVYYLPFPDVIAGKLVRAFYAGQTAEVLKLLEQDPAKVHAVYGLLQPALRDRSADIRQNYLDVANWRLRLDDFKAYTDLMADLVVKGAVIIWDVKSLNVASIQKHLEYIEKAKNTLNAAYHVSSVGLEFTSFRNLWAETDAVLIYANKCIEQGLINPVTDIPGFPVSLFPEAMASEGQGAPLLKGVYAFSLNELNADNGRLPVKALNQMYQGYPAFDDWFVSNEKALHWLTLESPEKAARIFEDAGNYRYGLQSLTILGPGILETPADPTLKNLWIANSGNVIKASSGVIGSTGEAAALIKTMEVNPSVGSLAGAPAIIPDRIRENKWLQTGLVAAAAFLLLLLLLILLFRRRRKNKKPAEDRVIPTQPVATPPQTVAAPGPAQPAAGAGSRVASTPKFCPKCGTPLKQGARFCSKCGNQLKM